MRKGAAVKGTIYETLLERTNYVNIDILDSYEEAIKALNNHSIDYFICPQRMIGEIIQMKTENLTYIIDNEQSGQFRAAVVIQNTEANQKLSENYITATKSLVSFEDLYSSWIGIDKGFKYINWTVPPNYNITINHLMNFNQEPYAYIDEETGEKAGLLPQIDQILSSRLNAKITFLETNSQKDYIPAVKNGTANITTGYFLNSELNDDELIVINTSMPSNTSLVIRYDNAEGSKEWAILKGPL